GNRCDVSESELLEYLGNDPQTRVITLYLEGIKDGKSFLSAARRVSRKKPVVVLKSGRTEAGKKATASHTGSISGEDDIHEAAFRQAGVIRANTFHELFDIAKVLSRQPLPKGNRIAVITSSGSLGVLTVDRCISLGLRLAEYTPERIGEFKKSIPRWMSVGNPLDVGPSGLLAPAIRMALTDENVDGIIVIPVVPYAVISGWMQEGMPPGMILDDVLQSPQSRVKPLIITTLGKTEWINSIRSVSGDEIPLVSSPENAAAAMAALCRYRHYLETAA
ncbi:MAG: CoA-binding protein, partial [Deltaproteobacteria bacterium]